VAAFDLQPQAPPADPDQTIEGRVLAELRGGNTEAGQDTVDEEFGRKSELFRAVAKNIARQIGVSHHLVIGILRIRNDVRRVEPGEARLFEHVALHLNWGWCDQLTA
jgi:hypothetical protein